MEWPYIIIILLRHKRAVFKASRQKEHSSIVANMYSIKQLVIKCSGSHLKTWMRGCLFLAFTSVILSEGKIINLVHFFYFKPIELTLA